MELEHLALETLDHKLYKPRTLNLWFGSQSRICQSRTVRTRDTPTHDSGSRDVP